ncbi:hypothetical protein [Sphaerisporangium sp. NPDC051011]|uniref:hypothetical protein n=1 Tax=Sphaerisporangium sp. NPDC051011 TaxID=3155792 RepID=UPI0033C5E252
MTFTVERAERPGRVLVVSAPFAHPGNWMSLPSAVVRPSTVAASVRTAIREGWAPGDNGRPFPLSLAPEDISAFRPDPS